MRQLYLYRFYFDVQLRCGYLTSLHARLHSLINGHQKCVYGEGGWQCTAEFQYQASCNVWIRRQAQLQTVNTCVSFQLFTDWRLTTSDRNNLSPNASNPSSVYSPQLPVAHIILIWMICILHPKSSHLQIKVCQIQHVERVWAVQALTTAWFLKCWPQTLHQCTWISSLSNSICSAASWARLMPVSTSERNRPAVSWKCHVAKSWWEIIGVRLETSTGKG